MSKFDVIVIGGGHNGLTTAALLAKRGKKVILLEKRKIPGGLSASEEFHKGYKTAGLLHDTSNVRANLIRDLDLEKFGLTLKGHRTPISIISDSGHCINLLSELDGSVRSISQISVKDAEAYGDYRLYIRSIAGWLKAVMSQRQPDLAGLKGKDIRQLISKALKLRLTGKKNMLEFLKIIPMSVADFLNERFETDALKAGLAFPALLGGFYGPLSGYTSMNLILWESLACEHIPGGPAQLVKALEKAAVEQGALLQVDSEVVKIYLNNSGAVDGVGLNSGESIKAPVIAASCSPKETFFRMLNRNQVGINLESQILNLRSRGSIAKMHLALSRKIQWKYLPEKPVEHVRLVSSLIEMEQASDSIKYGLFSKKPVLDVFIPTVSNRDLAPPGHEVVSIIAQYVPYSLKGGWTDSTKNELAGIIVNRLSEYTINLEDSIVAREILTPVDIESHFGIPGGCIFHIEHTPDQLIGRPVPACSQYKTPIPGLYLCGSGSHPGGGITCAPGALASRKILSDI